jgi:signal transduction histidine kinase
MVEGPNLLQISIADNGRGFDPTNDNKGNGLQNMQERAELLQATWQINSKHGGGCQILVAVPFTIISHKNV